MIFSKLCILQLVVATLAAFATATGGLGARDQCPVGIVMCCRKETGNYANRALAIKKLGATVAGKVNEQTPVWVKCSDQLAEVASHHTFTCSEHPVCCQHTASDLSVAIDCTNA